MAGPKKNNITLHEHTNMVIVRERGGAPVRLPLSAEDNQRLAQFEVGKYRGILHEYMDVHRLELQSAKPRELKELGESLRIAHELARQAYGDVSDPSKQTGTKADAELIAEVAKRSIELGAKHEASRRKNEPIEAEITDIKRK